MDQERALMRARLTSRDIPGQTALFCSVYLCSVECSCETLRNQTRGHIYSGTVHCICTALPCSCSALHYTETAHSS